MDRIPDYQKKIDDLLIPILKEKYQIDSSKENCKYTNSRLEFNGKGEMAILHTFLSGNKGYWRLSDFFIKEVLATEFIPLSYDIKLLNLLPQKQVVRHEPGWLIRYLI